MLKKSIIFSILAILLLLILQLFWLSQVIIQEKSNYKSQVKDLVEVAVKKELKHRRAGVKKKNSTFTTEFVTGKLSESDKNNKYALTVKDAGNEDFLNVTVDHFHQVYQKDHNKPFNITVYSRILTHDLDSLGMGTSYLLYYSDFNSLKQYYFKGNGISLNQSFEVSNFLTVTKDMKIRVIVFYPLSVYQGQFLSISAFSLVLLIFIVFLLVSQARTLSAQISLAQIKENLTRFFTHELRSPLQSALTGVEMMDNAQEKGDKMNYQKYTKVTKSKLQYVNNFVERMLDVNKLKSSTVKLNRVKFNLALISKNIVEEYIKNGEKEVNIEIDKSCNIDILGDINHITNALSNLIENAVKYSNESVGIKLEAAKDEKFTTISVSDNGIGIPAEDIKKIFDQFYRVKSTHHSMKRRGFGLGLNYVKWVAETHRGRVLVESKIGIGSKFTLVISNI